jgi:hypothetical protein
MIQCWVRGYDGVVIDDAWLRRFYGVRALRNERSKWLARDSKPWFVFQHQNWKGVRWGLNDVEYYYYNRVLLKRKKGNSSENYWDIASPMPFKMKKSEWVEPIVDKMELYLAQIALGTKPLPSSKQGG